MYRFSTYSYKDALYRISSDREEDCRSGIREARRDIEEYIRRHPEFGTALEPLTLQSDDGSRPTPHIKGTPGYRPDGDALPAVVRRMFRASELTGTGPMAAVAGAIAEAAGERALAAGAEMVVVENGGDIYLGKLGRSRADTPRAGVSAPPGNSGGKDGGGTPNEPSITVGLFAGTHSPLTGRLALTLTSSMIPAGLCSSSSKMGHSLSFGRCDLATVYADSASVSDACATLACNLIHTEADMEGAMGRIVEIGGVRGILCIVDDKLGMAGVMPELTALKDSDIAARVTKHERSGFSG